MFSFDRVVCINLSRRPERWAGFQAQQDSVKDWPFGQVERFEAIDGSKCPPPHWWKSLHGSWGLAMTTVSLLQDTLNRDMKSLLIFEDDAIFAEDFGAKARDFFGALPPDWDGVYLGGEDKVPPLPTPYRGEAVSVLRSQNTIRTHAYGLRARHMMAAYKLLTATVHWATEPKTHVDQRLAALQKLENLAIYEPSPWLVGQRSGDGDITEGYRQGVTFWEEGRMNPPQPIKR